MRPRLLIICAALLLAIVVALPARFALTSTGRTPAAAPPTHLVLIVMDGFREDYLKLAPMKHLHWLMKRGMFYPSAWAGQLESETPSDHATIATGVYPRTHGVIGFGWRDPRTGVYTYMPTNLQQIQAGELTQTIEQGGVPSISDLIHARNKHNVVIAISGEKLWAAAPLGTGADYVIFGREDTVPKGQNGFRPTVVGPNLPPANSGYQKVTEPDGAFDTQDGFAARLAQKLVTSMRPKALLLNLPATDIAGHYYGGPEDPTDMKGILQKADAAIGKVIDTYRRLGLLKHTLFAVMADHGMVAGRTHVPIHAIYRAVAHAGVSELDEELQTSIGAIWLKDPEHAEKLANILAADHFNGVEGVLYKVPVSGGWTFKATTLTRKALAPALLGADLRLADTEASANGADVLLVYGEDTVGILKGKSFVGMHGGFSWGAQHIPLVLAGPGVKHGVSTFPAKLVDVAPTIEHLLGLPVPSGVAGVILSDALTSPTTAERTAQLGVEAGRLADVRVLASHSRAESKESYDR